MQKAQPVLKREITTTPEKYFKRLDDLLKKNRGYGTLVTQDTGSNIPLNLTSDATPARLPELHGGVVALQQADEALQKSKQQQQYQSPMPEYAPPRSSDNASGNGDVLGVNNFNVSTPDEFNTALNNILSGKGAGPMRYNRDGMQTLGGYDPYPGQEWSPNQIEYKGINIPGFLPFEEGGKEYGRSTYLQGNEIMFPDNTVGTLNSTDGLVTMNQLFPPKQSLVAGAVLPKSQDELIKRLFRDARSQRDVTGEVGEYYGFSGESYNEGLDIGTASAGGELPAYSPFYGKVVGRTYSQYNGAARPSDYSEANGYGWGNSVMIELPNGVRMHYAHLRETPLEIGDMVSPNSFVGTTGESGNTYGKHLSISIRPPGGDVSTPDKLAQYAFSTQELTASDFLNTVAKDKNLQNSLMVYSKSPEVVDNGLARVTQPDGTQQSNQNVAQNTQQPVSDLVGAVKDTVRKAVNTDYGDVLGEQVERIPLQAEKARQTLSADLANTIDSMNPTGTSIDFGFTEGLRNEPELAKVKQADTLKNLSNQVAGIGNAFRLPELGLSEAGNRLANLIDPKVYASEIERPQSQKLQGGLDDLKRSGELRSTPTTSSKTKDVAQNKAGWGIDEIQNILPGISNIASNIFRRLDPSKISGSKKIGEASVGGDGPTSGMSSLVDSTKTQPMKDNRDAFFKAGGADVYGEYLKPGIDKRHKGALDLNIFKDNFFEEPTRVANTFANTYLAKPATEKYRTYIYNQYPIIPGHDKPTYRATAQGRYEDGTEWSQDYDEVDQIYYQNQYNQQVRDSVPAQLQSSFKFTAPQDRSDQKARVPTGGLATNATSRAATVSSDKPSAPSTHLPSTSLQQAYAQVATSPSAYSSLSPNIIPKTGIASIPKQIMSIPKSSAPGAPGRSASSSAPSSSSKTPAPSTAPVPTPPQAPKQSAPTAPTYQAPRSVPPPIVIRSVPNQAPMSRSVPKPSPAPAKSTNAFIQFLRRFGL